MSYISDADTIDIVRAVYLMEGTGYLYGAGGLGDQPCWLIEALEIFKKEQAEKARVERGRAGDKNSHKRAGRLHGGA